MRMEISVIFSTYNSEEWLEKVIIGFSVQTFRDFEIIIADDGSGEKTKALVERMKSETDIPIVHVWLELGGTLMAIVGVAVLWGKVLAAHRQLLERHEDLAKVAAEAEHWKREAQAAL